ncbi:MAG: hypothetical protein ACRDRI_23930 [Pseudonocardiaceae bacterium]
MQVGLAADEQAVVGFDAVSFRRSLEDLLTRTAAAADAGYPGNEDLVIDENGVPVV